MEAPLSLGRNHLTSMDVVVVFSSPANSEVGRAGLFGDVWNHSEGGLNFVHVFV